MCTKIIIQKLIHLYITIVVQFEVYPPNNFGSVDCSHKRHISLLNQYSLQYSMQDKHPSSLQTLVTKNGTAFRLKNRHRSSKFVKSQTVYQHSYVQKFTVEINWQKTDYTRAHENINKNSNISQ